MIYATGDTHGDIDYKKLLALKKKKLSYGQQQQMDINAYKQQQLANAKKSGGILNTNVESGDWSGMRYNPPNQGGNPNIVDRNQMPFGSKPGAVDRNQMPFGSKPGQPIDRNQMPFGSKGGNGGNQMYGKGGDPNEVVKMDTENKFVIEGGKKKKITTIKKTLASGEILTEMYKTDA